MRFYFTIQASDEKCQTNDIQRMVSVFTLYWTLNLRWSEFYTIRYAVPLAQLYISLLLN